MRAAVPVASTTLAAAERTAGRGRRLWLWLCSKFVLIWMLAPYGKKFRGNCWRTLLRPGGFISPPPPPPPPQCQCHHHNHYHYSRHLRILLLRPTLSNCPIHIHRIWIRHRVHYFLRRGYTAAAGKKRKWKDFFHRFMKDLIHKQEELQQKFLDTLEKRECHRIARMNREHEILVQERSIAAAKDAAQKVTEQNNVVADKLPVDVIVT